MRIPVGFEAGTGAAAYLVEGDVPAPDGAYSVRFTLPASRHFTSCACCAPRGPAATALAAMFRARATGAAPYFNRVILLATDAGIAAVRSALAEDVVASARFRFASN